MRDAFKVANNPAKFANNEIKSIRDVFKTANNRIKSANNGL